jgi:hypothetical protein
MGIFSFYGANYISRHFEKTHKTLAGYKTITYLYIIIKKNNIMPTLLTIFGLRFYFYSGDHEPMHIHVQNADGEAKFEIETDVKLIYNRGLKNKDLRLAESIIEENKENFINDWKSKISE